MTTEIRTFQIPDTDREDAQETLSAFLRTVEVERIDTAYADGGWRILVLYQDLRRKEESKQIESAIVAELSAWRDKAAARGGVAREALLPDDLLPEIARFAPTTERELSVILGSRDIDVGPMAQEIAAVVRNTLEALVD
ncbi:aldolase [Azospirillum sp. RWY-5-1]|uniref:Aldolase n=1 Tax=Azospirillum oleiclasticum TaxID=2735135 RepID=A0ABX2TB54_9PROT|nr:HRDC domain-containing protein [Azospirillum oleiclasticum]NYZ13306.1 aldolase [Azospirillum oleiclasticum]NYZ20467.1 aldolase [Azospirillum oleiclasticum]